MQKKVFVGLSGGVDSALAAYLLKEQGYDVVGVFIKNWDGEKEQCTIRKDLKDAKEIAQQLKITFHSIDFIDEYREYVFDYFLDSLEKGLTPNPDIFCNKYVKFKAFYDWAMSQGADFVATGHYAQINNHEQMLSGVDPVKDQTYFLYAIDKQNLAKIKFPLGELKKTQVRQLAKTINLSVCDKKDSTGICFIGAKNFKHFIQKYLPVKKGAIITKCGVHVGEHSGITFYTLGQRSGLNIGGLKQFDGRPWYIIKKDFTKNQLIISQEKNDSLLMSDSLTCNNFHWLTDPLTTSFKAQARIRHGQTKQECWVYPSKGNPSEVKIKFLTSQRAITPGQAAVLYAKDLCLGGGTIINDEL